MINTSATLAASSKEIANTVKSRHAMQEETLSTFLAQRQLRGEIPAHCRPQELAQYLSCILQGMSISAREGATLEKLQGLRTQRCACGLNFLNSDAKAPQPERMRS